MGKATRTAHRPALLEPGMVVAALVEGGRRGRAAVERLRREAGQAPVDVTLIAVIPHADNSGCTMSAEPLNAAVWKSAEQQLADAAETLAPQIRARRALILRARVDPSLASWAAQDGITTVLLPARGRPLRRIRPHPEARALRAAGLEVRVV